MRLRTGLAGAVALAAALATVTGTPAGAVLAPGAAGAAGQPPSRVVVVDGTGDVWRADRRTDEWWEVGDVPEIDLRRTVVRHTADRVVVQSRFVDLQPGNRTTFWVGFALPGRTFAFSRIVARRGQARGGHNLLREPGGAKIDCDGLGHFVDRDLDLVTIEVPRSCLGEPAWVRANVSAQLVRRGAPNFPYADTVHSDRATSNRATPRVWAPR
ncbi:hypothetical protein [Nocardioides solisilvae]|uniref:hypothetical protein n=1 Tax=Nocardioides solisilvae TaxID=1542435 RepID=UPI0013A5AA83|nr:hypothetical protein [Nocardioides solisilvae]